MTKIQQILTDHGVTFREASCGDGWSDVVDNLCKELIADGWDRQLDCLKEKFGGLRFYIGSGTEELHSSIDDAEQASYKTCEQCGKQGFLRSHHGWMKTECDECHRSKRIQ